MDEETRKVRDILKWVALVSAVLLIFLHWKAYKEEITEVEAWIARNKIEHLRPLIHEAGLLTIRF